MISFHSRVKRAKEFSSNLQDAIDVVPKKHRPKGSIWTDFVSGEMTAYKRRLNLGQLKELSGGDRGLLSNAKCLSEGVDVPSLDGVAFIDPKNSPTDIVQAVGRAIRLSKDKKVGTIVLPVFIKDGENAEASIEASNFKPVWNVLNALKAHDNVFLYELDQIRTGLGKRKKVGGGKKGFSKINFDLPESIDTKFSDSLKTYLVEKTTSSWNFWFGLLEEYVEREGHARVNRNKIENGYQLGIWVNTQRNNLRINKLTPDQIGKLEVLPKWSWNLIPDKWGDGFAYLQAFAEENGNTIVNGLYKTMDGFSLGVWVSSQRISKKKNKLSKDQIEKLEELPGFSWERFADKWEKGIVCLKNFIKENGHARVPDSCIVEGSFKLGLWVRNQRISKKKNKLSKNQIEKLEELPKWSWKAIIDKWNDGFAYLQEFVKENGHAKVHPHFEAGDGFPIGTWVSRQRNNKKKDKLPEDKIKKLEALPEWSWAPTRNMWDVGFSYLKEYVERYKHARVHGKFKTNEGFGLGNWVARQRMMKKDEKLTPEQIKKLEALKGWVWDATK
jgi:hypothetical protein